MDRVGFIWLGRLVRRTRFSQVEQRRRIVTAEKSVTRKMSSRGDGGRCELELTSPLLAFVSCAPPPPPQSPRLRRPQLVLIDAKPSVRKQILRELQIMHDCSSVYIVSFYGAFMADPHICICMEHMDRGYVRRFHFLTHKECSGLMADLGCTLSLPSSCALRAPLPCGLARPTDRSTTSTASMVPSTSTSSARSHSLSWRDSRTCTTSIESFIEVSGHRSHPASPRPWLTSFTLNESRHRRQAIQHPRQLARGHQAL